MLEQKAFLETRLKAGEDVMKSTEGYELEGLKEELQKIPVEKMKSKKLQALSEVARRVIMRKDAEKSLVDLKESMVELQKQIDFIDKKTD